MSEPSNNRLTVPLSIGDIVSVDFKVYRDHFKTYFFLAFKAFWWLLVPVYVWAKYSSISGQISRLVFCELWEKSETSREAYRHTDPKKWTFLLAGLLTFLIILITDFLLYFIILFPFGIAFANLLPEINPEILLTYSSSMILTILFTLIYFVFILLFTWIYSRRSIFEVSIAVEPGIGTIAAISRSWDLTKGMGTHLAAVYLVAFVITFPFYVFLNLILTFIGTIFAAILVKFPDIFGDPTLYIDIANWLLFIIFIVGIVVLIHPFWQVIKAVVYYDLRSRKEGIDLQFPLEEV